MKENNFYTSRRLFFGDIHNHCAVSYGHGPLADALKNAALQLDFVSITGHAGWPDMDAGRMPEEVAAYHRKGFEKLRKNREAYVEALEAANRPGSFVTFGGYELHSFHYGDYTILQKDPATEHIIPGDRGAMEALIRDAVAEKDGIILMPHHIGYKTGYRGIHWNSFNPAASPLVEVVSMHGCADEETRLFPYLHTMGPLDDTNTVQAGLARGYLFGMTGSTDHHSAHPGSYGYGRTAVWATDLSREALWQAFLHRRTYAVSGDRIECEFSVNGEPLGGGARDTDGDRVIRVRVRGGDALSRIEILKNNRIWHQENYIPGDIAGDRGGTGGSTGDRGTFRGKIYLEMGWGEKGRLYEWDMHVALKGMDVLSVEPRFRGVDVVDPLDKTGDLFAFTSMEDDGEKGLHITTLTFGNATAVTPQTQGVCFEVSGTAEDILEITMGKELYRVALGELFEAGKVIYTAGFLSPAMKIHRFVSEADYTDELVLRDHEKKAGDVYYARVFQGNGQAAWISPVRVE